MADAPMIPVHYYDGKSSLRQAATLRLSDGRFYLAGTWGLLEGSLAGVDISEPMGTAPRTLRFADGTYCEIADRRAFAHMLESAGHRDAFSVRLHKRWSMVLIATTVVIALVVACYVWGLPAAADALAPHIPERVIVAVSKGALVSLDAQILKPSALPLQRQQEIEARMAAFAEAGKLPHYTLNFRSAPNLPPNAFALPNGDIVIFDSLIETLNDDEAIAVFAHELGHVAHYDGLRQLIEGAVVSTAAAVYFGDLSSAVAALSTAALQANYSQTFESQADAYAAAALKRSGRSPMLLASALEKLTAAAMAMYKKEPSEASAVDKPRPDAEPGILARLFSSHPSVARRIEALKAVSD